MSYVPNENPEVVAKAEKYALAGLILSLLGFLSCGLGALAGIPLSIMGLKAQARKPLAIGGIVCGCLALLVCIPGAILFSIAVPSFNQARAISMRNACQENLSNIDGAKQQWALENNITDESVTPTFDVLVGEAAYLRRTPICPAGGSYTIGSLGENPSCPHANDPGPFPHVFPSPGGSAGTIAE